MNQTLLKPSNSTAATYHIAPQIGSKKLIIFFSATGAKPGKFNFWKDGNKLPCHRMFINNGHNEWYQNGVPGLGSSVEQTVNSIKRWIARLGVEEVYTCGGSMGGYAAILYGALLDASILAFAAETTLGIQGSRSMSHIRPGTKLLHPQLGNLIARSAKPVFLYVGEMDPVDVYCASKLKPSQNLKVTTLRGVDHGPPRYLRDKGLLPTYLDSFISNRPLPPTPADGRVLEVKGFADLFLETHQSYRERNWERTVKVGRQALELYQASPQCQFLVGSALMKQSLCLDALPHLSVASHLSPSHREFTLVFADALRQLGYLAEALDIYEELLVAEPENARVHYSLGLGLLKLNEKIKADESFKRAAELAPNNPTYSKRVEKPTNLALVRDLEQVPQEKPVEAEVES